MTLSHHSGPSEHDPDWHQSGAIDQEIPKDTTTNIPITIEPTLNQARTDFNFICSKLSYKDEELPIVCETVQRIECALVLLKQLQPEQDNH